MRAFIPLSIILFLSNARLKGQNSEIASKLNNGELEMTFPSIYFKHNSADYAKMPYTVDSCFKYIVAHIKVINSRPIWRDSSETEELTNERIKKIKLDLNRYAPSANMKIQSMRKAQKVSRRTIYSNTDSVQIQFLLSLNSVFDVSGMIKPKQPKGKNHMKLPRIGSRFDRSSMQRRRQIAKQNKKRHEAEAGKNK